MFCIHLVYTHLLLWACGLNGEIKVSINSGYWYQANFLMNCLWKDTLSISQINILDTLNQECILLMHIK